MSHVQYVMCKIQYVEKSETSLNIKLNYHRKDIIKACGHFKNNEHTFSKHGKFIISEQLQNINTTPTETLKLILRERQNSRIMNLKTLRPYGLNQELK